MGKLIEAVRLTPNTEFLAALQQQQDARKQEEQRTQENQSQHIHKRRKTRAPAGLARASEGNGAGTQPVHDPPSLHAAPPPTRHSTDGLGSHQQLPLSEPQPASTQPACTHTRRQTVAFQCVRAPDGTMLLGSEAEAEAVREAKVAANASTLWHEIPLQQPAFDFIEQQPQPMRKHLKVFSAEREQGGRLFIVATADRFFEHYEAQHPDQRHHYEIIRQGQPCHLYFDIEFNPKLNPHIDGDALVDLLVDECAALMKELFNVALRPSDKVIELDSSGPEKFSRHVIIPQRRAFAHNGHVNAFVRVLVERLQQKRLEEDLSDQQLHQGSQCAAGQLPSLPCDHSQQQQHIQSAAEQLPSKPPDHSQQQQQQQQQQRQQQQPPGFVIQHPPRGGTPTSGPNPHKARYSDMWVLKEGGCALQQQQQQQQQQPVQSSSSPPSHDNGSHAPQGPNLLETLFIDTGVYTRNRAFRLCWSSKAGKKHKLLPLCRYALASKLGHPPSSSKEGRTSASSAAAVEKQSGRHHVHDDGLSDQQRQPQQMEQVCEHMPELHHRHHHHQQQQQQQAEQACEDMPDLDHQQQHQDQQQLQQQQGACEPLSPLAFSAGNSAAAGSCAQQQHGEPRPGAPTPESLPRRTQLRPVSPVPESQPQHTGPQPGTPHQSPAAAAAGAPAQLPAAVEATAAAAAAAAAGAPAQLPAAAEATAAAAATGALAQLPAAAEATAAAAAPPPPKRNAAAPKLAKPSRDVFLRSLITNTAHCVGTRPLRMFDEAEAQQHTGFILSNKPHGAHMATTARSPVLTSDARGTAARPQSGTCLSGYGPSPLGAEVDAFVKEVCAAQGGAPGASYRTWMLLPDTNTAIYTSRGTRFCANIGRHHKSNGVFWVIDLGIGAWHQRCHDPDCFGFRSPALPLPVPLWQAARSVMDGLKSGGGSEARKGADELAGVGGALTGTGGALTGSDGLAAAGGALTGSDGHAGGGGGAVTGTDGLAAAAAGLSSTCSWQHQAHATPSNPSSAQGSQDGSNPDQWKGQAHCVWDAARGAEGEDDMDPDYAEACLAAVEQWDAAHGMPST